MKTQPHHRATARFLVLVAAAAALASACTIEDVEDIESEEDVELRLAGPAPGPEQGAEVELEDELEDELDDELDDQAPQPKPQKIEIECPSGGQNVLAANCAAGEPFPTCYSGMNGSMGVCDVYECRGTALYRCEGIPVTDTSKPPKMDGPDTIYEIPKRSCLPKKQGNDCTLIPL